MPNQNSFNIGELAKETKIELQFNNCHEIKHNNQLIQVPRYVCNFEGFSKDYLNLIIQLSQKFINREPKSYFYNRNKLLKDKRIVNIFFESSTRTRTSFEIAARNLGADIVNLPVNLSSISKGETLLDTLDNLEAMGADMFVVRHSQDGISYLITSHLSSLNKHNQTAFINAGDGIFAHPTQSLGDITTIDSHGKDFKKLKIAIVGDVLHSRVFHSLLEAFTLLEVPEINCIAPKNLAPSWEVLNKFSNLKFFEDMDAGIEGADIVIMLRIQKERMLNELVPNSEEFFAAYGLDERRLALAKEDALVMHPGPINREVEIQSSIANSSQSIILDQVYYGLAARSALLLLTLAPEKAVEFLEKGELL